MTCGSELLKLVCLLDVIFWIKHSWDDLEASTIVKCFAKSGF